MGSSAEGQFQYRMGLFALAVLASYLVHRDNHVEDLQLETYDFPSAVAMVLCLFHSCWRWLFFNIFFFSWCIYIGT